MAQHTQSPQATQRFTLDRESKRIFIGLMLGMLVSSISQTIVGPALPRIVAELGGMEHYSWLATAAMLVSAITVPIMGKLSDIYGRRSFYLGGLVAFMLGSVISGLAVNFWMLVAGRAVQGLGMGTLMPLSQTIIGDIIPPRSRGQYQGIMGSVFGLSSVAGPLAGGFITDHLGWRWLFFVSLPVGVVSFFVIAAFLHLPHQRREVKIDFAGINTLAVSLICLLSATSFGGTTWAWSDPRIIGLYAVGTLTLIAFLFIETRAEEPVLPLRLFRSSVFTLSNVASFAIAMMMFGAIIYIPIYAQGVLGVNATNSGLILMPLMLGLILVGIVAGMIVTKTGRYKEVTIAGVIIMIGGYGLLARLTHESSPLELTAAMVVLGIGLGAAMQQYTLIIQNAAHRQDLGVATASNQFFRNVGSTVGIAVFGTVMTSSMHTAILRHLPPGMAAQGGGRLNASAVLDPHVLAQLPPVVATAVRQGLAESLHATFLIGLPVGLVALIATLFIRQLPLRDTVHGPEDAGREMLDAMSQTTHDSHELVPALGRDGGGSRTGERLLGLQLGVLAHRAKQGDAPLLRRAVTDLGEGDFLRGLALLQQTSVMLAAEDEQVVAQAEGAAALVSQIGGRRGGVLSPELRKELATLAAQREPGEVLTEIETTVTDRYDHIDLDALRGVGNDLNAAFLGDLRNRM